MGGGGGRNIPNAYNIWLPEQHKVMAGAAASTLCTTPLETGCRRPYEAPEPTVSAHQRIDPVGIVFGPVSVTGWNPARREIPTRMSHRV